MLQIKVQHILQFGSLSMNVVGLTVIAYEQYGVSVTFIYCYLLI